MNKRFTVASNPTKYVKLGALIVVLANPLLYLAIGSTIIDIKNLFGVAIDRQSISFNTDDYFIQAMEFVTLIGMILILLGLYFRRKNSATFYRHPR